MLIAGLVLSLYVWVLAQPGATISQSLIVSTEAAIVAGFTLVYGTFSYFFTAREKIMPSAAIGYLLVIAMVALLIKDTGYLASPFIALWMIVSLSAAVFGVYGAVPIVAGILIYIVTLTLGGALDFSAVALSLLLGALPLGIGYLIWRPSAADSRPQTDEDKSFHELTSKLDAVSGQSEIVIAAIADCVISIDGRGVIQLFNPAAQRILGWGKADAIGLNYQSVLKLLDSHDTPPNEMNDPIHQALNTNAQTQTSNFRLQTADGGKSFVASITTTPIGTAGSGAIIVFRDITHENEEERQQAEFISTASHEMRTPVASIEGYLGLALNPATATVDEKAREYIGKAQAAAKHLGRLFQDLLDVTKADDGRLSDNPTVVEVVPFIRDIIIGQLPSAQAKGLEIVYPPQPDLSGVQNDEGVNKTLSPVYFVNVDADHLREIIGNLLENAVKYTPTGSITLNIAPEDEPLVISIKDSGLGIPKADIGHLFQKFYRVDSSDTREIGGTGLGLYLSRKLSEAIGGKLWVESVYQQGSTFFLKLPRIETADAERLRAQQQAASRALAESAAAKAAHLPPHAQAIAQQLTSARPHPVPAAPSVQTPASLPQPQPQIQPETLASPVQRSAPTPPAPPVQPAVPVQQPPKQTPPQQP